MNKQVLAKGALTSVYAVLMSTAGVLVPDNDAYAASACVANSFYAGDNVNPQGAINLAGFSVVGPTGVRDIDPNQDLDASGNIKSDLVLVIKAGATNFVNDNSGVLELGPAVTVDGLVQRGNTTIVRRNTPTANLGMSQGITGVTASGVNGGASTGGGVSGAETSGGSSGPVVLASVDVSSSQAEDLIRQRRELAQQEAAADQTSAAETAATPAEDTGTAKLKKAKKKASKSVPKPVAPAASDSAAADPGTEASLSPQKSRAGWAQIYGDYEVHKNMAPGSADNPTRRQRTFGQVGGADTTYHRYSSLGDEQFQFGLLGGHSETKSKFSDTPNSQNASIREEGGFAGAYASYRVGRFAADALFKADFYQLDKRAILLRTRTTTFAEVRTPQTLAACPTGQIRIADSLSDLTLPDLVTTPDPRVERIREEQRGSVSETNYSIGGNLYYRFDLTEKVWFEPMVGSRFTYTDFGSGAADIDLTNGQSLRVQGGARIGTGWVDVHSHVWTVSLLGMLYSDVYVDGYSLDENGFVSTAAEVDEGKLRALAQLSAQVEVREGLSFLGQADVRGGEDVRGFGGRLGVRYEW